MISIPTLPVRFAAKLALFALVGAFAIQASANDVTKETIIMTSYQTTHNTWCTGQNDITITELATFKVTFVSFVDNSGTPIKTNVHLESTGTLTGPTGKTITDRWVLNETASDLVIDPVTGEVTVNKVVIHGVQYHVTVPGEGVILLAAGDVILDFGTNSFRFSPTYQKLNYIAVCSYLGP